MSKKSQRYNKLSDLELFLMLRDDSQEAFTALYNRHSVHLYAVLMKYIKSEEIAENALQEVFLKLWRERATIPAPQNVKGYLYTAMRNAAINMIKRYQNGVVKAYEIAQNQSTEYFMDTLEDNEKKQLIEKSIKQLPQKMRQIVLLRRKGHSNTEVSEILNMSINTVAIYYSRATKVIKENLKKNDIIFLIVIVFII